MPRINGRIPRDCDDFWDKVEDDEEGLSEAIGCYVFGVQPRRSQKVVPWYVGRTNAQSFRMEASGLHQRDHYNDVLGQYRAASPKLFLIAGVKDNEDFSRNASAPHIGSLENYLRLVAYRMNPNLMNTHGLGVLRSTFVPGVLNAVGGWRRNSVRSFKAAIGLE